MDNSKQNTIKAIETSHFYEKLWAKLKQKLTYAEIFRIHFILDNIREFIPQTNLQILDLGCGRGWMAPFLSPFGTVTGVDFSPSGIEFAQKTYGQFGHFKLANPELPRLGLPETAHYDLVICSEVIEHVTDQHALIQQITTFLKPGGWLILTTPNGRIWPQYKATNELISRMARIIIKNHTAFQPIENWISPHKLDILLQKVNFSIIRHEGQTLYRFGIHPLVFFGWLEAQLVDILLRKFKLHHRYAQAVLPVALYQIIIAKNSTPTKP